LSVERSGGTGRAVFLSYASQGADAARRICDTLRAAYVEVRFDQSELRGGDAWDAKIRKQIKDCALFVPVISANTQAGQGCWPACCICFFRSLQKSGRRWLWAIARIQIVSLRTA
jgi:hypothetical protein